MNNPAFLLKLAQRLAFSFASGFVGGALIVFSKEIGDIIFGGPLEFPVPPDPGSRVLPGTDKFLSDPVGNSSLRGRHGLVIITTSKEEVGEVAASNEGASDTSSRECA